MGKHLGKVALNGPSCAGSPILAALLLATVCLVACSHRANDRLVTEALAREQAASGLVLGLEVNGHLEYLDMTTGETVSTGTMSELQDVSAATIDLQRGNDVASSDGQWSAECDDPGECRLSSKGAPEDAFTVWRPDMLSSLYWSPKGTFVFYVRKAPSFRLPLRCSFEDERDVIVRDLRLRQEGVVRTVCGGFPYRSLRWYRHGMGKSEAHGNRATPGASFCILTTPRGRRRI